jgi:HAD superfamily hydrolase (TIGR01509 family)
VAGSRPDPPRDTISTELQDLCKHRHGRSPRPPQNEREHAQRRCEQGHGRGKRGRRRSERGRIRQIGVADVDEAVDQARTGRIARRIEQLGGERPAIDTELEVTVLSRNHELRPIELVIFDCDGVLVDSEPITNRVFAAMLAELGLEVTLEFVFDHFVGHSMASCWERVEGMLGRRVPDEVQREFQLRANIALAAEVRAVAGVEAVLDSMRVPYCVASSGNPEKMATTLGATGLLPRFGNRIFSATQVARGKPAPDIFLYAAASCGADPSACAVVEDSPAGVVAGVAAGMTVYGYCAFTPRQRLEAAGANFTFDRMSELPDLLHLKRGAAAGVLAGTPR